jgi:hypothetical protein
MSTTNEWSDATTAIFTRMGGNLTRQHAAQLAASAIDPEVAYERGYVSINSKNSGVLSQGYGFAEIQRNFPGLLIPIWGVAGGDRHVTAHYRPDSPRTDDRGRPVKYESPAGSRNIIDVPPRCQAKLRNPGIPLWITEGVKKADAAASRGLTCISISGVWNWVGKNENGGITALPDWKEIALNSRRVYLTCDSDSSSKPAVSAAQTQLANWLILHEADVYIVHVPSGPEVQGKPTKVGFDDYIAQGGEVDALILTATRANGQNTDQIELRLGLLAKMSRLQYDQVRTATAEELGIRVGTLDKEVASRRNGEKGKSKAEPETIEPCTEPVDGPVLFQELCKIFTTFMAVLSFQAIVALALWILHTYAFDAAEFSPIIIVTSPRPRCGKSRLLDILSALVFKCKLSSSITPAALFRSVDKWHPTFLVDECDNLFSKDNPKPELLAVFNAGNKRGSSVERCVGDNHEPTSFDIFCQRLRRPLGECRPR